MKAWELSQGVGATSGQILHITNGLEECQGEPHLQALESEGYGKSHAARCTGDKSEVQDMTKW